MWPRMHFLDLQGLYVFWTAGLTTALLNSQSVVCIVMYGVYAIIYVRGRNTIP